jgi:phage terminase Nu1 subunit (DNA packaging protein)
MAGKNGASLLKEVITLSDLASLCVCSERTIQRLTKRGVLRQAKDRERRIMRGRYVLGDALPRFVEHLRDSITSDDPNERAYVEARARRMTASAEMTQLELRHKRGELLECAHVDFVVTNLLSIVKNHMLSIPSRLMHQLVGKTDPREINMIVRGEVHRALREASEFDTKKLRRQRSSAQRTSKHANGDDGNGDDADD